MRHTSKTRPAELPQFLPRCVSLAVHGFPLRGIGTLTRPGPLRVGPTYAAFGSPAPGARLHLRPAAYAVITDLLGRVAVVRAEVRGQWKFWLPGGGSNPQETPEQTVVREVREELCRDIELVDRVGVALQYFYADDRWYAMEATFLRARFDGDPAPSDLVTPEYEMFWMEPARAKDEFFHECHAWAVEQG